MKCYQEKNEFEPIILTIETAEEAQTFFDLIDKIDRIDFIFSKEEKDIIIELSNALTCGDIVL